MVELNLLVDYFGLAIVGYISHDNQIHQIICQEHKVTPNRINSNRPGNSDHLPVQIEFCTQGQSSFAVRCFLLRESRLLLLHLFLKKPVGLKNFSKFN